MEILIGCLAVLFVSASTIDWLLGRSTINLRERLREARATQERDRHAGVVTSANILFCDLFDAIYGKSFLSWRRFSRSCLLSVVMLFFVSLLIGLDRTFLPPSGDPIPTWLYFMSYGISLAVNLVADYFSLQETRWVLERARGSSLMGVSGWVCTDLVLTLGVFFAVFSAAFVAAGAFGQEPGTTLSVFLFDPAESPLLDTGFGLPFLLSTFGTSALWLLFALFVLVVTTMRKNSRFLDFVFDAVADNPAPARAVAVIIAVPIIVVGLVLIVAGL